MEVSTPVEDLPIVTESFGLRLRKPAPITAVSARIHHYINTVHIPAALDREEKQASKMKCYTSTGPLDFEPEWRCVFCLCGMEAEEKVQFTRLDCNHSFHTDCMNQWSGQKCPLCRTDVLLKPLVE